MKETHTYWEIFFGSLASCALVAGTWLAGFYSLKDIKTTVEEQVDLCEISPLAAPSKFISEEIVKETVFAVGGADGAGIFLLEDGSSFIESTLLDPSKKPELAGYAYYDPRNDSWVIQIEGYRIGVK